MCGLRSVTFRLTSDAVMLPRASNAYAQVHGLPRVTAHELLVVAHDVKEGPLDGPICRLKAHLADS
jgi:hypothetical protein